MEERTNDRYDELMYIRLVEPKNEVYRVAERDSRGIRVTLLNADGEIIREEKRR